MVQYSYDHSVRFSGAVATRTVTSMVEECVIMMELQFKNSTVVQLCGTVQLYLVQCKCMVEGYGEAAACICMVQCNSIVPLCNCNSYLYNCNPYATV